MSKRRLAYLGMGIMGSAMAAHLAGAEHEVRVWNRTPGRQGEENALKAGAQRAASLGQAVEGAEIVFLCLGDAADLERAVLDQGGVADCLKPGSLIVDMSTSGPLCAGKMSEELKGRGLRFLDAPVSGGDVGARNATLTIMVGGSKDDFDECLPLFECLGKNITYCGPAGSGQGVKLCNQILCAVNMVAVCEALSLAESLALDPQLVVDVCSTGAAGSWALANLGARIVKSDFKPGFMVKHMLKDLRLAKDALAAQGVDLPGTDFAQAQFESVKGTVESGDEMGTQAMMLAYRQQ